MLDFERALKLNHLHSFHLEEAVSIIPQVLVLPGPELWLWAAFIALLQLVHAGVILSGGMKVRLNS